MKLRTKKIIAGISYTLGILGGLHFFTFGIIWIPTLLFGEDFTENHLLYITIVLICFAQFYIVQLSLDDPFDLFDIDKDKDNKIKKPEKNNLKIENQNLKIENQKLKKEIENSQKDFKRFSMMDL